MNIEIPPSQLDELNALAAQTGKGVDELVQEVVCRMLAYNDWFKAQVQIAVDQIKRGEFLEEAEVNARVQNAVRL